jgi:hypothetical protein
MINARAGNVSFRLISRPRAAILGAHYKVSDPMLEHWRGQIASIKCKSASVSSDTE